MASKKDKDRIYEPPLKIAGEMKDVLKAAFRGKPDSVESEKSKQKQDEEDKN